MDSTGICSDINDTPILTIESSESESLSMEAFSAIQSIRKIQETEHGTDTNVIAMEHSPSSAVQSLKVKLSPDIQSLSGNAHTQFNSLKRPCAFDDAELGNRKKRLTLEEETFLSLDRSCHAMLNGGDASCARVGKDILSSSSPMREAWVNTLDEDGDCGSQKDNYCTLTENKEDGLSATISAPGAINKENSLADEFAEFMASAFVATSCSKDPEKDLSSVVISEVKCNGSIAFERTDSNEVPGADCNGSNELPEDKRSGSNELLLEERNGLNELHDGESNGSNDLHEEKCKGSNELTEDDDCTGSNELPEEQGNGSNELPEECNGSNELPKDECTNSNELHEKESTGNGSIEVSQEESNNVSNQLTVSEKEHVNSNELQRDKYEASTKLRCEQAHNSEVPSETPIHLAEIVPDDCMSTSSPSEVEIKSESKDNEEKDENGLEDFPDYSNIRPIMIIPDSVVSTLESQNMEESHLDISDVPLLDGHLPPITDGTTKEICEESNESNLSPVPRTSTQACNSVDLDLGVDDVGAANNCLSPSASQCSETSNVTETNGKNVRRSTRKISQSERASTVIEIIVKDTPRRSGRPKRNLNDQGDVPTKSPNVPSEATAVPHNGRAMGMFLMDVGQQVVSKQIYKDLINIQKVRMQATDSEYDRQLHEKLVVTHKNLIVKNEAYKCGEPLRCRCLFKCNSVNVLEHHRERGWEDSSGKTSVFRCCYCKGGDSDPIFSREAYLAKHMKAKHDREYKYVQRPKHACYFCKYETNHAAAVIVHRRTCMRQFQLRHNLEPTAEDRDIPLVAVLKNYKIAPKNEPSKTQVVNIQPKPKQVVTIAKQITQNSSYLHPGGAYAREKNLMCAIPLNGVIRPPNLTSLINYTMLPGPATCVSRASLTLGFGSKAQIFNIPPPIKSAPILSTMQVCPICNGIVKDATVMAMHMQVCHPNVNVSAFGPIPTVVSESDTGTCYLCQPPRTFINQSFLQQHIACHHNVPNRPTNQAAQRVVASRPVDVSQMRTRCRMCYALIIGNPVDHMSSMHVVTLWTMLKRCFCYLCPDQFVDVADFETHMVVAHAAIFPTQEHLWTRIQPTIPPAEIRRAGLDTTLRKFGEIKCPSCDARHLSRVALYRHFYLEHGFGNVSKPCSICKVLVEDEMSHMLEAHVRACKVVAIRLNDDIFQKYYALYLDSQEVVIHDDDLLLNKHCSETPLGTVRPALGTVRPSFQSVRSSLGTVRPSFGSGRPSLGTVRPSVGSITSPLGTVVLNPYREIPTFICAPVRLPKPTPFSAVTISKKPPHRSVVTLPKSVPRLKINPSPRVRPKVYDTVIILDDDDDDDDVPIEKPAAPKNISAANKILHESVVLTSDDSDDDSESSDDDDDDDSSNKDEVQDVWDDGELIYKDDDNDGNHQVIDCNASCSSGESFVYEPEDDLSSDDVEELDIDDSVDKPKESGSGSDGVYPMHLSSMVPSPSSQSPSPSDEDPSSVRDENGPSSPTGSEHVEEVEEGDSDVDLDNVVMEVDGETIVIVNEDSD